MMLPSRQAYWGIRFAVWAALASAVACSSNGSLSSRAVESSLEHDMSPLDKAILEDYPARPWSKNVPSRGCSKDKECGDGFCDRGRCAAIWTSGISYGQRCKVAGDCAAIYLCIDGRCRSCVSDAECIDEPDNQDPKCTSDNSVPGSRGCRGVAGSGEGDVVPGFPSQRPKK